MRKTMLIAIILAFTFQFVLPAEVHAESPKIAQLIFGIILLGAGTALAMDGFSKKTEVTYETVAVVKDVSVPVTKDITTDTDVSNPQVTSFTGWSWNKYKIITWWADASGAFTNTGNVTLSGLQVDISFYDNFGLLLKNTTFTSPSIAVPGQAVGWSRSANNTVFEAFTASVQYSYSSYLPKIISQTTKQTVNEIQQQTVFVTVKKEETKIKSVAQGAGGIAVAGLGSFMVVNYFVAKSKMEKRLSVIPIRNTAGFALQYKFG